MLPQSCSTSMCCERLRECPKTHFTPNLVRHLCAARDLENTRKHILPQSCSTSMCCERLREYPKTHFTPILFDIFVLRETQRISENTSYPNLVRHLCAARDLKNTRNHILPQSCSTSMCCERFREYPKTHFTPILFDICVLREIWRLPENTFLPQSCSTSVLRET